MRRHGWAYRVIKDLESNHEVQIRFHKRAIVFWAVNGVLGTIVAIVWPHWWVAIGVLYVFWLSIYANADTDYDAMSAAQAALHAKRAEENTRQANDA